MATPFKFVARGWRLINLPEVAVQKAGSTGYLSGRLLFLHAVNFSFRVFCTASAAATSGTARPYHAAFVFTDEFGRTPSSPGPRFVR